MGKGMDWLVAAVASAHEDECQMYPFAPSQRYGLVAVGGRKRLAHHVVMELAGIKRPAGKVERRHLCGRARCVNHLHLVWGSHSANERDKRRHGTLRHGTLRNAVGTAHRNARLTEASVRAIRRSGDSQRVLAARYGVDHRTIGRVLRREAWTHL